MTRIHRPPFVGVSSHCGMPIIRGVIGIMLIGFWQGIDLIPALVLLVASGRC